MALLALGDQGGRLLRARVTALAATLCAGVVCAATNWHTGHRLTPLTMQGRSWVHSSEGWGIRRAHFLMSPNARIWTIWGADLPHLLFHGTELLVGLALTACLLLLVALALRAIIRLHASRYAALCVWAAAICVMYFLLLPEAGHGGRYLAIPLMLVLPLLFFGLYELLHQWRVSRQAAWAVVTLAGVITAAVSIPTWAVITGDDITQINTEHGAMAAWIRKSLPDAASAQRQIAAYDIGRIGDDLDGNLIDLGGLVDATYQPYLVHHRTADYLRVKGVRYVILPGELLDPGSAYFSRALSLDPSHGAALRLVHTACADAENSSPGLRCYGHGVAVPALVCNHLCAGLTQRRMTDLSAFSRVLGCCDRTYRVDW